MNQIDLYAINIMIFMLVLCLNVTLCSFIRLQSRYCAFVNNDAIVSDTRYTESNYECPSRAMSCIILSHK